ncbi:MAG: transposase [Legionella sp.]|nr:transposase [Legionella sp.]
MNKNKAELKRVKKKYSPQFKDQVMEWADKEGIPQVAKDLGLAESLLYSWKAQKKRGGDTLENQKLQQAELSRLKRENARLAEENAFLKKAAADSSIHCNTSFNLSAGDRKFNVFLGLSFNSLAIRSKSN